MLGFALRSLGLLLCKMCFTQPAVDPVHTPALHERVLQANLPFARIVCPRTSGSRRGPRVAPFPPPTGIKGGRDKPTKANSVAVFQSDVPHLGKCWGRAKSRVTPKPPLILNDTLRLGVDSTRTCE
eukprot:307875-Amphidinium_carterae.1